MARRGPKNTLGSLIANYKYNYRKASTVNQQHDIAEVIKRLEGYKKYKEKLQRERDNYKRTQKSKLLKKLKKLSYKKAYSLKPIMNPYVEIQKKLHTAPDPTLYERYKTKNIYSMYEFRHLKLPKSNNLLNAGQGWHGLKKAWIGFLIAKKHNNKENMINYASAAQKFAHMLQVPMMPDFPDLGLSAVGFNSAKALKEYFIGYENELIGNEFSLRTGPD